MASEFFINDWLVEPQLNRLCRGDRTIRIEPKTMQVLVCLAAHPNELISKQTLKDQVWGATSVTDDSLIRCISDLRRVLEDDPRRPAVIETITRAGYRLIARVSVKDPLQQTESRVEREGMQVGRKWASRRVWVTAVCAVPLLVALLVYGYWPLSRHPVRSLAVLPFQNMSGDAKQDFFADAMTDRLISELAQSGGLEVTSRTSVMRYKSARLPLSQIAEELGVDVVVEGSVTPIGGRVSMTAQLIDVRSDRHLWSETYVREYKGLLGLQDEAARLFRDGIRKSLGK